MSGGRAPSDGRSGAARLLDVLAAFESRPGELTVKDIAAAAQLPVSTTYRIVNDLLDWGGLERVAEGRYRTGERLRRIAGHPSWEEQLRSVCGLFAHDFVLKWGHAVALSAWIRGRLVCVETIGGRHTTIELARSGEELSILATSAGKLLIATTPLQVDPFAGQLPPRTDPPTIARQLAVARRHGYCAAYGEAAAGQASLSVPIGGGACHGHIALTVMTPLRDSGLPRLVEPLRRTAAAMHAALDSHSVRGALAGGFSAD